MTGDRDLDGPGRLKVEVNERSSQELFVSGCNPQARLLQGQIPHIHCADARKIDRAITEHLNIGLISLHLEDRHR